MIWAQLVFTRDMSLNGFEQTVPSLQQMRRQRRYYFGGSLYRNPQARLIAITSPFLWHLLSCCVVSNTLLSLETDLKGRWQLLANKLFYFDFLTIFTRKRAITLVTVTSRHGAVKETLQESWPRLDYCLKAYGHNIGPQ